jgi:hypothetical protein
MHLSVKTLFLRCKGSLGTFLGVFTSILIVMLWDSQSITIAFSVAPRHLLGFLWQAYRVPPEKWAKKHADEHGVFDQLY